MHSVPTVPEVVAIVNRAHGPGTIAALMDAAAPVDPAKVHPSGSLGLDIALGIGGYPRGAIVEVYGQDEAAKTTLATAAIVEAQKRGHVAAVIDLQHAFDVAHAVALGVNLERLLVSQPDTGEQAFDILTMLTRSGAVDLIVVSSIDGFVPQDEIRGEHVPGDGARARMLAQQLRVLTSLAHKTGTTVLFLAGSRVPRTEEPGWVSDGNNALKFYASVRIYVVKVGEVLFGEHVVGEQVLAKVVKNKAAPPFREARFEILWTTGIRADQEARTIGIERGLFKVDDEGCLRFNGAPAADLGVDWPVAAQKAILASAGITR